MSVLNELQEAVAAVAAPSARPSSGSAPAFAAPASSSPTAAS